MKSGGGDNTTTLAKVEEIAEKVLSPLEALPRDAFQLLTAKLSLKDQGALAATSTTMKAKVNRTENDALLLLSKLSELTKKQLARFCQNEARAARVKALCDRQPNNHAAYALWALMADDVKNIDSDRLTAAINDLGSQNLYLLHSLHIISAYKNLGIVGVRDYIAAHKDEQGFSPYVTLPGSDWTTLDEEHIKFTRDDDFWDVATPSSIFQYANLQKVDFTNVDLAFINFRGANFSNANMTDTNLLNTKLHNCILHNTWLRRANMNKELFLFQPNPLFTALDAAKSNSTVCIGELRIDLKHSNVREYDKNESHGEFTSHPKSLLQTFNVLSVKDMALMIRANKNSDKAKRIEKKALDTKKFDPAAYACYALMSDDITKLDRNKVHAALLYMQNMTPPLSVSLVNSLELIDRVLHDDRSILEDNVDNRECYNECYINLSGVDFKQLGDRNVLWFGKDHANFHGANLSGFKILSPMDGCDFSSATLVNCVFDDIKHSQAAAFSNVNFTDANMCFSVMQDVVVRDCDFTNSVCTSVNVYRSKLINSDLNSKTNNVKAMTEYLRRCKITEFTAMIDRINDLRENHIGIDSSRFNDCVASISKAIIKLVKDPTSDKEKVNTMINIAMHNPSFNRTHGKGLMKVNYAQELIKAQTKMNEPKLSRCRGGNS